MNTRRTVARLGALSTAASAVVLSLAAPASAHVGIDPSTTAAGAYTVLTVAVPHGCEESPTTKIAIKIPEPILAVTPTRNPFWDVEATIAKLAKPTKDAHGNAVTERVETVEYTATTPLPADQRDAFELSLQLPETPGKTLTFPVIQTCEEGETAWVEVPSDGGNADDLEHPAPTVTITDAERSGDGGSGHGGSDASADTEPTAAQSSDRSGKLGLAFGLAGLALGAIALVQVRRRS